MSEYLTPCQRPENNPEDWFIEKDGRQYADEDLLSHAEMQAVSNAALAEHGEDLDAIEAAIDAADEAAVKANLVRRRHAKDACYECYFRTQCLEVALTERPNHGTWGGYYPEELRQVIRLRDERQKRRAEDRRAALSRDADVAAGE